MIPAPISSHSNLARLRRGPMRARGCERVTVSEKSSAVRKDEPSRV